LVLGASAVLVAIAVATDALAADQGPGASTDGSAARSPHAADTAPSAAAAGAAAAGAAAAAGSTNEASRPPVVVWPTLTPVGDAPATGPMHRPLLADKALYDRAAELDATLRDAVQDLGFTLYVADAGPAQGHTRDEDLVARAASAAAGSSQNDSGTWVVSPRIEAAGGGAYVVRLVAVAPRAHELRVRVETVPAESVSVRGLVMLRALLTPEAAAEAAQQQDRRNAGDTSLGQTSPTRSQGRAVLAVSAGLLGAFTAFSLQNASGETDPRVLYPLLALGTGVGIGAALLVADEWDVTTGDAWYLAAGGGWAATAGFLLATGQNVQPSTDRYSWALGGGLIGLGLATFALTQTPSMDDGDATLTHSGAALGLLAGAAVEWLADGSTVQTPATGMGYGSAIGLVGAGFLATRVTLPPSRVLLIDLGVGGGALAGAAAASPLVFENPAPAGNVRGWLSATLVGSLAGGGLAWWLTRDVARPRPAWLPGGTPIAGVIGSGPSRRGEAPIYGVGWTGPLP
jgi:hypothetical protein